MDSPWPRCPEASALLQRLLDDFCAAQPAVDAIRRRLHRDASVLLEVLVDHWLLPENATLKQELSNCGFIETTLPEGDVVWVHPQARLPRVRFKPNRHVPCLVLGLDSIPAFVAAHGLKMLACHGDDDSAYQCGHVYYDKSELMLITRRGYTGFTPGTLTEEAALYEARKAFQSRNRDGDEAAVIAEATALAQKYVPLLGAGRTTDEFFAAEREFYLTRNAAARWQQARQESVGIGWSNHDHHTYRSSRASFQALTGLFLSLGFSAREKFYAGAEAGWGAQIFEHPTSRIVIFADVDVTPDEIDFDFATTPLPPRTELATIGLWCALHGSSVGAAGLHHLECEFDCRHMVAACSEAGIGVMAPFTTLPMLWQAFTLAELWQVPQERLDPLVATGAITPAQAEKFATTGATGSHLEILQRWEGFKGFNKTGISGIIHDTDARRQAEA